MAAGGAFVPNQPAPFVFPTFPINPASYSPSAEWTCPSCLFSGPMPAPEYCTECTCTMSLWSSIDGKKVGRGSQKPQDMVVRAFRFGALPDPEPNKKRRFFGDPPAEKCERDIHKCTAGPGSTCCGKWHSEVVFALALRPPLPGPGVPGSQLHEGKAGGHPTFL